MSVQQVLDEVDRTMEAAIGRLLQFLRIQSVSTDPAYRQECRRAAEWLMSDLCEIGFEASLRPTPGHPMVVARGPAECGPRLFYGHYDVQPVDPPDEWDHPPFEPLVEARPGGRVIRGRGASDDKGQLMTFLEACRAWKQVSGSVPRNLKFLFEGEEESGSPSLIPFLNDNADELKSEIAIICDTGLFDRDTPAIVVMLRGILSEEVTVTGPDQDIHSGMFGGAAANPLRILTKISASLHDSRNRVTVPGFYDGVTDPPADVLERWQALGAGPENLLRAVGLTAPAGETDRTALEMIWSRPTCDMNGIQGGYSGDGFKTVIPSQASAKISFRLVSGQDPAVIRNSFRAYVRSMLPPDCRADFKAHGAAPACRFAVSHPLFETIHGALAAEWPSEPVYAGCGGSIPVAGHFQKILGIDSVLAGFGLDDDRIHSPNEKYDLRSFHRGIRTWARTLSAFA